MAMSLYELAQLPLPEALEHARRILADVDFMDADDITHLTEEQQHALCFIECCYCDGDITYGELWSFGKKSR
jgi:hypothetical protein